MKSLKPPPPKKKLKKTITTKSQHYIIPKLKEVEAWAKIGHDGMGKGIEENTMYNVEFGNGQWMGLEEREREREREKLIKKEVRDVIITSTS